MTRLYEKAAPQSQRELLDDALSRLVDATMYGDRDDALLALVDALAYGLAGARLEAEVWAARELAAVDGHPT